MWHVISRIARIGGGGEREGKGGGAGERDIKYLWYHQINIKMIKITSNVKITIK